MAKVDRQTRLGDLVEVLTELVPNWSQWVQGCAPNETLSYIRLRLLHALQCHGEQTMSQLATRLGITQRRITALVDALESDGLVARKPHPNDGRSVIVSLSAFGRDQVDANWQERQAEIRTVFGDLTNKQQKQLLAATTALNAAMRQHVDDRSGARRPR